MAVLDQSLVDELRDVMGADFTTLVDSFERDGLQRLEALRAAVDTGDQEALRAVSHSFKGSSSNVGAEDVADTCKTMEEAAREGALSQAGDHLETLESQFREALDALRK